LFFHRYHKERLLGSTPLPSKSSLLLDGGQVNKGEAGRAARRQADASALPCAPRSCFEQSEDWGKVSCAEDLNQLPITAPTWLQ
jgi:hypothetical protein